MKFDLLAKFLRRSTRTLSAQHAGRLASAGRRRERHSGHGPAPGNARRRRCAGGREHGVTHLFRH
jgi:hypothetical protein